MKNSGSRGAAHVGDGQAGVCTAQRENKCAEKGSKQLCVASWPGALGRKASSKHGMGRRVTHGTQWRGGGELLRRACDAGNSVVTILHASGISNAQRGGV